MRALWAGLVGVAATAAVEVWARRGGDPYDRNQGFLGLLAGLPVLTALADSPRSGPGLARWLADTGSALSAALATRALASRGMLPVPARVPYNYPRFDYRLHRVPTPSAVGGELVVSTVTDLDSGRDLRLREIVGARPLVVEFGSVTCPVYTAKIARMGRLAARCAEAADFVVLYTREAHPGPRYPAHATPADKRRHAADLRTVDREQRRILLDGLDGPVHRRYGGFPNSVLLVGTDGIVSFWSEWNDPERTERELRCLLAAGGHGARVTPCQVEGNLRPAEGPPAILRMLLRLGFAAFADFIVPLPAMVVDHVQTRSARAHG